MEIAGSAVGIAALGIQVCQGLLTYYDDWKSYQRNIGETHEAIADLAQTLTLLRNSLEKGDLDEERARRVEVCLKSCENALQKLSAKATKLRKHAQPEGLQRKAWSEIQRLWYPLRASTLTKLREIVSDVQDRLHLAVQVLQLDVAHRMQDTLSMLDRRTEQVERRLEGAELASLAAGVHAWLDAPDAWTNHSTARQVCEPQTGTWLLESSAYEGWKTDKFRHLWLHGKAGCGKTVLCSTVIEDVREHCENRVDTGYAIFYFSFSDNQKQSYKSLLRSLVSQLAWSEPGSSMLRQLCGRSKNSEPRLDDLERILLSSIRSYQRYFILLDALDECPEGGDARQAVLECVERLAQSANNLKFFVTSRELAEVRDSMRVFMAEPVCIDATAVDVDICRYVSNEVARDRRLCKLTPATKAVVERSISQRADGMFRWAYCQLQELKKLKSFRPSFVEKALSNLPATLDDTYARILTSIDELYRQDALKLLQWLAYAKSPPTLGELVDAVVIDPKEWKVDLADRGSREDTLDLLCGLVTIISSDNYEDEFVHDTWSVAADDGANGSDDDDHDFTDGRNLDQSIQTQTRVRLAHFSVKEFLESDRILDGEAQGFHLDRTKGHEFLTKSCITYITHYSSDAEKTLTERDLATYPLLQYAACFWHYHSSRHRADEVDYELFLLNGRQIRAHWLHIYDPEEGSISRPFKVGLKDLFNDRRSAIQHASVLGLEKVVQRLVNSRCNTPGIKWEYAMPLLTACEAGNQNIVQILLRAGADPEAAGESSRKALVRASVGGFHKVVCLLLKAGADVDGREGGTWSALEAAADKGSKETVRMLLNAGANANADGGKALAIASRWGHDEIVQALLDAGADVNASVEGDLNALGLASTSGHETVVQILLDAGTDINTMGSALVIASNYGYERVVEMLLKAGADVNAKGRYDSNALESAAESGHERVVRILLDAGADVNAKGTYFGNALEAASVKGHEEIVQMLLDAGADVNAKTGNYGHVLIAASAWGRKDIVRMLLGAGAGLNAKVKRHVNALEAASLNGYAGVVRVLLDAGADVSAWGTHYHNVLEAA